MTGFVVVAVAAVGVGAESLAKGVPLCPWVAEVVVVRCTVSLHFRCPFVPVGVVGIDYVAVVVVVELPPSLPLEIRFAVAAVVEGFPL